MEWMLMPYRRYADFSGRSRRMEYWMFTLFVAIVYSACAALMFVGGFSFSPDGNSEPGVLFWLGAGLIGLFALGTLVPMVAVVVRRLHDRDMSGWWYLGAVVAGMIPFVGIIASIALLVVMCLEGTRGPNRFGPDPKDPAEAEVFA